MNKVLVTGANGMLGQDLCPILQEFGYEVIKTDIDTMDITDLNSVKNKIMEEKPDFIIHCAAYTNVDKAEDDLENAILINKIGTENVAKVCEEINATLVYISTDYVFDGEKTCGYKPDDKTNPLNNYGLTKLQGEQAVQKYCKKYYIVRTSWLYGIHGKNFVETMILMADNPEIKVVNDQIGCPTWTVDLSNGIVVKLLQEHVKYGIYHVCGGGSTSWYGFAQKIFELANLKVNLIPCTTEEFSRPAKRPKCSIMYNNDICRNWEFALKDYMKLREETIK